MKIEWLSWYGNEAMCTMSEIRVFGSNMASTMLVQIYIITSYISKQIFQQMIVDQQGVSNGNDYNMNSERDYC